MNFTELFNRSYAETVEANSEVFFTRFYQNFLASSPVIEMAFRSVDIDHQRALLDDVLLLVVDFAVHRQAIEPLKRLAQVHLRAGVSADMYELWVQALLKTASQLDPNFRTEEALAWRVMLAPGIEFMKHYRSSCEPSVF